MGQFSFLTQDTNESIWSTEGHQFKVWMFFKTSEGEDRWVTETAYEGYGVFGREDFFSMVSTMNGGTGDRDHGISLCFKDGLEITEPNGTLFPQLYTFGNRVDVRKIDFTNPPQNCPHQGWFPETDEDEDGDEFDEWCDRCDDEEWEDR
jgi:hypothetical protein